MGFGGWAWAEIDYNNLKELPKPEQRYSSRESIITSISTCISELDLDPSRAHLIGFSQGAAFTLYCGLTNPKMFHGLAALCGFFEYKKVKDEIDLNEVKNLNIFVSNGVIDEVIPIHLGRMTERGLKKLGLNPTYNEYNTGHTISNDCMNDLLNWIQSIQD
jgi:predicted esterase